MGYVEKIMGDNEHAVYRTHLHAIVLFERIVGWLVAFLAFVAVAVVVLASPADDQGIRIRWWIGLVVLVSLVIPLYLIVSPWVRGLRGHQFLKKMWQPLLAGLFILGVALLTMVRPDQRHLGWIALVLAVFPLAGLVRSLLGWFHERFIITNRRVMEVRGIINKHVRDSALEKVNDVDLNQSIVGRILGYGTVQIITGSDIGVNMFRRISNPVRFKRAMLNAKEDLHRIALDGPEEQAALALATRSAKPGLLSPEDTDQPDLSEPDIPALIAELASLRNEGILSEDEFQAKKRELLDRL